MRESFFSPQDVAIYYDSIYVVDTENNRIQVFDLDGNYLTQFGSNGSKPGKMITPGSIDIHKNLIYVGDAGNERIQVFDLDGNYIHHFGKYGSNVKEFNWIAGIDAENDRLYVTDTLNDRVQVFAPLNLSDDPDLPEDEDTDRIITLLQKYNNSSILSEPLFSISGTNLIETWIEIESSQILSRQLTSEEQFVNALLTVLLISLSVGIVLITYHKLRKLKPLMKIRNPI